LLRIRCFSTKLLLLIALSCGVVAVITIAALLTVEVTMMRREAMRSYGTQADMVATHCVAAMRFGDRDTADETLRACEADPSIVAARIVDASGEVFAQYVAPVGTEATGRQRSVESDPDARLKLSRPIRQDNETLGILEITFDLSQRLQVITDGVIYSCIAGALAVAASLLMATRLTRMLSKPVEELAAVANQVSEHHDYSLRAKRYSDDELGALTDAFNHMLGVIQAHDADLARTRDELEIRVQERTASLASTVEQLESEVEERKRAETERAEVHSKLMEVSRMAGMSEVATGVLHNVGNVLNSVNVTTNLINQQVRESRVKTLKKTSDLIQEHRDDFASFVSNDERGKKLPQFLEMLADCLIEEQTQIASDVNSLTEKVDHIREIVSMQQSYGRVAGTRESVQLHTLIEDALKTNDASLLRHGVNIERRYEQVPDLITEKHKVLQILVNLISNAKHALSDAHPDDRRLILNLSRQPDDSIRIQVSDNGVGIRPEHMEKVFNHGFTTKPKGHGFGLHSSALAAQELGGQLTVASDGPGCGATFTLTLPVHLPEKTS